MTDETQKGGVPAFPTYHHPTEGFDREGMTLRDWFAGMSINARRTDGGAFGAMHEQMARLAYQDADALLAERDKADD